MLAYSSVEHMGVLALGVGLGGAAAQGALLHAVNHSLAKAMLFLLSGNLLAAFASKRAEDVRGALRVAPVSAGLWLAGFLAISGSPPFGPFLSELAVLRGALAGGHLALAALYLALLGVAFAAMSACVLPMVWGEPPAGRARAAEPRSAIAPPALLGLAVLVLGLVVPAPLARALAEAARLLGAP
jgi:hydrogenase-4 component F